MRRNRRPPVALRALPIALSSALVLGACSSEDGGIPLGRFTIDEDIPETRVQGGGVGTLLPGAIRPLQLDITASEEFESERYAVVNSISIESLVLEIAPSSEDADRDLAENGIADDFDFIDSLALSIEATIDGELRREPIAGIAAEDPRIAPDAGSRRLSLDTTGANILPFVEAEGGYELISEATGEPPPDDVVFGGEVGYRISVGFR